MNYAIASVYGSTPVPEAILQCENVSGTIPRRSDRPRDDQPPAGPTACHAGQLRPSARAVSRCARKARELKPASRPPERPSTRPESRRSPEITSQPSGSFDETTMSSPVLGEKYFVQTAVGLLARTLLAQGSGGRSSFHCAGCEGRCGSLTISTLRHSGARSWPGSTQEEERFEEALTLAREADRYSARCGLADRPGRGVRGPRGDPSSRRAPGRCQRIAP